MHDHVRDVAIVIGSSKHFVRAGCSLKYWPMDCLDQYDGISLMRNKISDLPDVLECPKLKILLLQYNKITLSCSHEFFSGMKALKVLDLSQDFYIPFHNPIRHPNAFNDLTCGVGGSGRRAIKRRAQSIKRRAIKRRAQVIKRYAGHDGEARHHIGLRARFVVWRQVARDARVCLGYLTKTDAEAKAEAKTKNWLKTSEKLFVVLREILCNTL
ncbi:hypothetical protein HYC85_018332 [Camellia sinensis]|uniref:Uncharacterized protein n=1 Tax=Camellia sinensis TaxID=4442 RepID=A0A7J7GVP8_CAMSI|nr:hypothetical protein HYC85_018332 [Camellia sinensis]